METSRDAILRAIREVKPEATPRPDPLPPAPLPDDAVDVFAAAVQAAGGTVEHVDRAHVAGAVARRYPDAKTLASATDDVAGGVDLAAAEPADLAGIDVMVCEGELGVLENGAIWLNEAAMGHRVAPFLTQHLAIVVPRDRLVPDMHAAYARIRLEELGFGVFIAGPSKTADIEQSLVLGAHGPRSLLVLLV